MSSGTSHKSRPSGFKFPKLPPPAARSREGRGYPNLFWGDLLAIGGLLVLSGMILFLVLRG